MRKGIDYNTSFIKLKTEIMYYNEKMIDGYLCYQSIPNGEWTRLSLEQVTAKLSLSKLRVKYLEDLIKEYSVKMEANLSSDPKDDLPKDFHTGYLKEALNWEEPQPNNINV